MSPALEGEILTIGPPGKLHFSVSLIASLVLSFLTLVVRECL